MPLKTILPPWMQQRLQQKYVPVEEAEGGKRSELTDVDWKSVPQTKTKAWYWHPKLFISILAFLFIGENLFLLANVLFQSKKAVPDFPMEGVMITENKTWEAGATKETNQMWEDLIPGATGWVQYDDPSSVSLGKGLPSNDPNKPDAQVYIVTWAHQHHCLKILRKAFWELIYKGSESPLVGADMYGKKHTDKPGGGETPVGHLMHCFDYLRQTTACQSDLTVEQRSPQPNPNDIDIDGYHVTHQCKSRKAVAKWLLDNAPPRKFHPYLGEHGENIGYSEPGFDSQHQAIIH